MERVLLLSGGLDSAVLLADQVARRTRPLCLAVSYGQRHAREVECSRALALAYDCPWECIGIPAVALAGSALTGQGKVPHGRPDDPVQVATVVPNRNMVLISLAVARAVATGREQVLLAAHAGDAAIYPDCRKGYLQSLDRACLYAWGVSVGFPFLHFHKRDVVARGRKLGVDFSMTWSCYEGGDEPCGRCGACVERAEALAS